MRFKIDAHSEYLALAITYLLCADIRFYVETK